MTASPKYPPTITEIEVTAYKRFSKECAKQEKLLYGKTALQDKVLKEVLGADTKIDWALTFEWALSLKNMFDREGTEAFLDKIAPDLVTKLLAIEAKTKTFLTLARALLNGLGYGTVPSSSGPPLGAGGPAPPEKLTVTRSVVSALPVATPETTTETPAATTTPTAKSASTPSMSDSSGPQIL